MNYEIANEIVKDTFAGKDPVLREFVDRTLKEDATDLYVEYYNKLADIEWRPDCDEEKNRLKVIVNECRDMIVRRVLREHGYDQKIILKYVK